MNETDDDAIYEIIEIEDENRRKDSSDFDSNLYSTVDKRQMVLLKLQSLCYATAPRKEKNTNESAKIFYELGMIYRHESPNKLSLIRSAALFNAAIVRKTTYTDQVTKSLHELCNHIQNLASCHIKEDLVQQANLVAKGVVRMRFKAKQALESLHKIPDDLKSGELFRLENQKVDKVREIQNGVTTDYKRIMANLSQFCESLKGKAPCSYALVGMGSLAREEITPFSDFEHVIILQELTHLSRSDYNNVLDYFRWYSVIFHVVIINLGETIIPSVAIPDLNDKKSRLGDWFYDAVTKCGISFDGMMPHACKFPLGNQKTELIKPVSEMLEYLSSEQNLKNGYHLADILTKTCFVYGDKSIYESFAAGVKQKLRQAFEKKSFKDIEDQLHEDINNFAINKQALSALQENVTFNVKRLVYRSTTLFISAWGRIEGIEASSSFEIVSALRSKDIISDYTKCKLLYAVALACEIRLRVYSSRDRQDDMYEPETRSESEEHSFVAVVGKSSLINYFQIAYVLQVSICQKIGAKQSHLIADPVTLNIEVCSALGIHHVTNDILRGNVISTDANIDVNNFDECLTYMEEGMQTNFFNVSEISRVNNNLITQEIQVKKLAYRYYYFSKYLYHMRAFENALKYAVESLKQIESVTTVATIFDASCNELAGCCLFELGRYKQARFYFHKVIGCYWYLSLGDVKNIKSRFAVIHYYLGRCYKKTSCFSKAIKYFYKAMEAYEDKTPNYHLASIHFHLALCLSSRGNHTVSYMHMRKALETYQKLIITSDYHKEIVEALKFFVRNYKLKTLMVRDTKDILDFRIAFEEYSRLTDDIFVDKNTSLIFLEIGNDLMELQLLDLSYFWLQKSLTALSTFTCELGDDKFFGLVLQSIGSCLMNMDQYQHSLKYLKEALKKHCSASGHRANQNKAEMFRKIGLCHLAIKETGKAHANLMNALKTLETLSVDVETDEKITYVLDDLGNCFIDMQDYESSLQCLQIALKIKKNISSNVSRDDGVALTYYNIGRCLKNLSRPRESIAYLKSALNIQTLTKTTAFGAISTMNCIGLCLMELNRFCDSHDFLKKACTACGEVVRYDQSLSQVAKRHMADTLNNLGSCCFVLNKHSDALDAFGEALKHYYSQSRDEKIDEVVFYILNNIGLCFLRKRSYSNSLDYFKQSLDMYKLKVIFHQNANLTTSSIDEMNLSVAALHNNVGLCLLHLKCPHESVPHFERSISLYQKSASTDNHDVITVFRNVATACVNKESYSDCFIYLNDALFLQQKISADPKTDKNIAELLLLIGTCKKRSRLFQEALSYFERSLAILRRLSLNEAEDKRVLRALYECGTCLSKLGKYETLSIEKIYLQMTLKCLNHWQDHEHPNEPDDKNSLFSLYSNES